MESVLTTVNKRNKMSSASDYKVDTALTPPHRAADFLFWASEHMPGRPLSYQHLTKVAFAMPRLPHEESQEVKLFRKNRMGQVKKILLEKYKRDLVSHPGMGVRATIGSEDVARTSFQKKTRRLKSAISSLDATKKLIDPSEIKDRDLKAMVGRVSENLKLLNSPDFIKRLELPAKKKDEEEK